ncbi:MAG: S-layer homology domain-containing protein [Fimbriimonadaceae bacterium]
MVGFVLTIAFLHGQYNLSAETSKWVDPLIQRMKTEGLLTLDPEGYIHGRRPPTRFELAVATHATAMHLKHVVDDGEVHGIKAADQIILAEWSQWAVAGLLRLTDEFKQELTLMEVDVPSFVSEVKGVKRRMTKLRITDSYFMDVSLSHWAAGAVTEMGRKGLLKGYPGKKFNGGG